MATLLQVINPDSVSFEQIKTDIITYLTGKPEWQKWKDFWEGSAGTTLIELMAGTLAFLQYVMSVSRRETYLQYAEKRTSSIGIARNLGYSAFRGQNVHITVKVTPTQTITFSKFDIIGSYGDYDVVALDNYILNIGVQADIDVVIGKLKSENITIPSDELQVFRFISESVSEDVQVLLNDSLVPTGSTIKELLEDKYLVISNASGAVDIMYTNDSDAAYPYDTGDILKVKYIETKDVSYGNDTLIFLYGTVDLETTLSIYSDFEPVREIRVQAPLAHETQQTVRGREDYRKLLRIIISGIVDANGRDVSSAVVALTYVRDDESLMTSDEKTQALADLEVYRPFGVNSSSISDPTKVDVSLQIDITLKTGYAGTVTATEIDTAVGIILEGYEKQLGISLDLEDIESLIEDLKNTDDNEYVKIARISITNGASQNIDWDQYYIADINITLS